MSKRKRNFQETCEPLPHAQVISLMYMMHVFPNFNVDIFSSNININFGNDKWYYKPHGSNADQSYILDVSLDLKVTKHM